MIEPSLFDDAADALRGLVGTSWGALQCRPRRYGLKVWFGDPAAAAREHYEAQVVGTRDVPEARVLAIEVGFHAEHPREDDNDAVLGALIAAEKRWRTALGPEAVGGVFLGRATRWRRLSETWVDPDLSDPSLSFEIACRLADYVAALEPARRER